MKNVLKRCLKAGARSMPEGVEYWPLMVLWDGPGVWSSDGWIQQWLPAPTAPKPICAPAAQLAKFVAKGAAIGVESPGRAVATWGKARATFSVVRMPRDVWKPWKVEPTGSLSLNMALLGRGGADLAAHVSHDDYRVNLSWVCLTDGLGVTTDGHRMCVRELGTFAPKRPVGVPWRAWDRLLKLVGWYKPDACVIYMGTKHSRLDLTRGGELVARLVWPTVTATFPPYLQVLPKDPVEWSIAAPAATWRAAVQDAQDVCGKNTAIRIHAADGVGKLSAQELDESGDQAVTVEVGSAAGSGFTTVGLRATYLADACRGGRDVTVELRADKQVGGVTGPSAATVPGPGPRDTIVIMPIRL